MRCSVRSVAQRFEPLERQRQVRAALGRHERVDLVDDDRVDGAQRLARVRREQQVERLRRRDQDVGRLALEAGAFDAGVSPVRMAIAGVVVRVAARRGALAMPASGARRLRSTSTASAFSGEM